MLFFVEKYAVDSRCVGGNIEIVIKKNLLKFKVYFHSSSSPLARRFDAFTLCSFVSTIVGKVGAIRSSKSLIASWIVVRKSTFSLSKFSNQFFKKQNLQKKNCFYFWKLAKVAMVFRKFFHFDHLHIKRYYFKQNQNRNQKYFTKQHLHFMWCQCQCRIDIRFRNRCYCCWICRRWRWCCWDWCWSFECVPQSM